ncbi:exodeoxyribonuclease VII small subunit [Pseudorhodoferax soli]|uniref:Exodeoxyribonuclease VII small subunit n=1 Tax=Pseudorhodoferax soli TaxID=545864 RepID=A0A368XNS9_9BURK|nr:exodeoxyribonuclease VII small subunit [Pseudorhodoferax soli]RCW69515.1 exodeoxyribonuclease VII small subunit [Pseudorhodoferax soli]
MTQPQTFREAYEVLQRHAQDLRNSDEPNIDDLLSVVTQSVAAYKVCRQRIDAVEAALKEALADVGESPSTPAPSGPRADAATGNTGTAARARPAPPAAEDAEDDDVPF